jgi:hypothetical protein
VADPPKPTPAKPAAPTAPVRPAASAASIGPTKPIIPNGPARLRNPPLLTPDSSHTGTLGDLRPTHAAVPQDRKHLHPAASGNLKRITARSVASPPLLAPPEKILEERRVYSTLFFHQEKSLHNDVPACHDRVPTYHGGPPVRRAPAFTSRDRGRAHADNSKTDHLKRPLLLVVSRMAVWRGIRPIGEWCGIWLSESWGLRLSSWVTE